jgi:serine/threonine protein kinase
MSEAMTQVGTAGYCAPEVCNGRYGHACDIYSAGMVLQQLAMCGNSPARCALLGIRRLRSVMTAFEPDARPVAWQL